MKSSIMMLIPIVIYLGINLAVGVWSGSGRASKGEGKGGFLNEYFIGSRSMGGFILAMTLIATYTSASSFVGGPGLAYTMGLGWVYLSMIQVPTAFLTLGVLGKKFAVIARKINAVTVTDYLRARYKSPAVVIVSSLALVIFFMVTMVGQYIGGAILFKTVTGYSYFVGLVLFGLIVVIYTTIGGFRAVVITDTIQGVVMVFGTLILLFSILKFTGGIDAITTKLDAVNPGWVEPTAGGNIAKPFLLSFWILVGLGVVGLPQTAVRGMGFKDSKSMHKAMVYGTVVLGFIMIGMHLAGVFSKAIITTAPASSDTIIPEVVLKVMHPVVAGIFIAAPIAAVMSTVSSMLILASAAIVKDLYLNYISKAKLDETDKKFEKKISRMSLVATAIIGLIVFLFAVKPPDLIVWINLFAFGALEATFLCPIIFGLYWKKANATGAILSSIVGVSTFIILTVNPELKVALIGSVHAIVPTIAMAIIAFVIGSLVGKKPDAETIELFYSVKD